MFLAFRVTRQFDQCNDIFLSPEIEYVALHDLCGRQQRLASLTRRLPSNTGLHATDIPAGGLELLENEIPPGHATQLTREKAPYGFTRQTA